MYRINGSAAVTVHQQGDVAVVPVTTAFDAPVTGGGQAVLAYGEATGHAHAIRDPRARLVRDADVIATIERELRALGILADDARVDAGLVIDGTAPVALTHEEHEAHVLHPGRYAVLRQREYAPGAVRRVAD